MHAYACGRAGVGVWVHACLEACMGAHKRACVERAYMRAYMHVCMHAGVRAACVRTCGCACVRHAWMGAGVWAWDGDALGWGHEGYSSQISRKSLPASTTRDDTRYVPTFMRTRGSMYVLYVCVCVCVFLFWFVHACTYRRGCPQCPEPVSQHHR